MPKYSFECAECTLKFERNLKVGSHVSHECPSCKEEAPLVVSGFGFSFAPGTGSAANSGVHDHDYPTADKAVGRSSDERWKHVRAREAVKKSAREQGGTHALIRHTGKDYIDYEPMSDLGREARRSLAKEALKRVKQTKDGGKG
jgi:putative FmdB family regulatory protein